MTKIQITARLIKQSEYVRNYITKNGFCLYITVPNSFDINILNKILDDGCFIYDYVKYYSFWGIRNKKFVMFGRWLDNHIRSQHFDDIEEILRYIIYYKYKNISEICKFGDIPEIRKIIKNSQCKLTFYQSLSVGHEEQIKFYLQKKKYLRYNIYSILNSITMLKLYDLFEYILCDVLPTKKHPEPSVSIMLKSPMARIEKLNDSINNHNIFRLVSKDNLLELFKLYVDKKKTKSCMLIIKQNLNINETLSTKSLYSLYKEFLPKTNAIRNYVHIVENFYMF